MGSTATLIISTTGDGRHAREHLTQPQTTDGSQEEAERLFLTCHPGSTSHSRLDAPRKGFPDAHEHRTDRCQTCLSRRWCVYASLVALQVRQVDLYRARGGSRDKELPSRR